GDEGDVGAAVRVVLDRLDLRRDVELGALEVDDAVELLVAAAATARGDAPVAIAAGRLALRLRQALLRALVRDLLRLDGSVAQRGSDRIETLDSHGGFLRLLRPSRWCRPASG